VTSTDLESRTVEARAALLSTLGDPIRLRILDELAGGTLCVCELQSRVAVAPNLLSYHLRVLREAGLVDSARRGRWIDYRLSGEAAGLVSGMLPVALRGGAVW
jgi:ArsR family transcriptional regulator, arsenate/arsenite/antimonite-responsive transcriptional repressor